MNVPDVERTFDGALELRDVVRSGFQVAVLRIANAGVAFATSIAIARALGPAGRGLFALPIAVVGIAFALSHLGLEHAHAYLAARKVDLRRLWANATVAAAGLGVGGAVLLIGVLAVLGRTAFEIPIGWVALVAVQLPIMLHTLYGSGLLQLAGRLPVAAWAPLVGNVVFGMLAFAMWAGGSLTPFRALAVWSVSNVVAWAFIVLASRVAGLTGARPDRATLVHAVAFGSKAYVGVTLFFLLLRVDQLLVEGFLGPAALGIYSLAVVLAELLWLVTDPFSAAVLRHQVAADRGRERVLADATARVSLALAIPLAVIAWTVAPYIVPLAYGEPYASVTWPFRLLLLGVVALSVQRPLGGVLVKEGRVWLISWFGMFTLAVNVVLNLVLLPRIGIPGAAIASAIGYTMLSAAYVAVTRRGSAWSSLVPTGADLRLVARSLRG